MNTSLTYSKSIYCSYLRAAFQFGRFGSMRALLPAARDFTEETRMTEERQDLNPQDAAVPRWIRIGVVALAVVSLVALGAGLSASTRAKELEQSLHQQDQQTKKANDVLDR